MANEKYLRKETPTATTKQRNTTQFSIPRKLGTSLFWPYRNTDPPQAL